MHCHLHITLKFIQEHSDCFYTKNGQHACPCGARCLPNRGKVLAPVGQNCCQTHAQYINFVVLLFLFPGFYQRMQFLSYEFLTSDISKPSRQLADSWITVNWLDVRILQQKTRQSDSFFHFCSFRFGNHDEGTSLKFLILGLAMSISFRYHWSLPLRSPSI